MLEVLFFLLEVWRVVGKRVDVDDVIVMLIV